jgi:MATE family multidrug resistance protein
MGGAAEASSAAATASSPLLLPRAPPLPEVGAEVRRQVGLAAPLVACSLLQYSLQVVSVMFAGHLGELSLSGASVAASFANVTGFSVLVRSSRASRLCQLPKFNSVLLLLHEEHVKQCESEHVHHWSYYFLRI